MRWLHVSSMSSVDYELNSLPSKQTLTLCPSHLNFNDSCRHEMHLKTLLLPFCACLRCPILTMKPGSMPQFNTSVYDSAEGNATLCAIPSPRPDVCSLSGKFLAIDKQESL